jgi:hypothetical protein
MNKMKFNHSNKNKQQGMVLLIAMVMLLLITILGVSAVSLSKTDTQVAGNSIFSGLTFQGAESALGRSVGWFNTKNAILDTTSTPQAVPASYFVTTEYIGTGSVALALSGTVVEQPDKYIDASTPLYAKDALPSDSTYEYKIVKFSGTSKIAATSAKDRHSEGRAVTIVTSAK